MTDRIGWAARHLPVLGSVRERFTRDAALAGFRVAVHAPAEPASANLALTLRDAGAEVDLHGTRAEDDVTGVLEAAGVRVFAENGASAGRRTELSRACLEQQPDIVLDDGAVLTELAHLECPELLSGIRGVVEESVTGADLLRARAEQGTLGVPVVATGRCGIRRVSDASGTGQSCVMALLDVTNLQLAGRIVVVVGYSGPGRGVAYHAAALGARVVVSETDPVKALHAVQDGYRAQSLSEAAPEAEVVIASTGRTGAVTPEHVARMRDGVLLVATAGQEAQLPVDHLGSMTTREVRSGVTEYVRPDGRSLLLVGESDGLGGSDGGPLESTDLAVSLRALTAGQIAASRTQVPGVHPPESWVETTVATTCLTLAGGSFERTTR